MATTTLFTSQRLKAGATTSPVVAVPSGLAGYTVTVDTSKYPATGTATAQIQYTTDGIIWLNGCAAGFTGGTHPDPVTGQDIPPQFTCTFEPIFGGPSPAGVQARLVMNCSVAGTLGATLDTF